MWTVVLVLHAIGIAGGWASTVMTAEEDWTSLLQVSATPAVSARADDSTPAWVQDAQRRATLKLKIIRARAHLSRASANLARMEAELAQMARWPSAGGFGHQDPSLLQSSGSDNLVDMSKVTVSDGGFERYTNWCMQARSNASSAALLAQKSHGQPIYDDRTGFVRAAKRRRSYESYDDEGRGSSSDDERHDYSAKRDERRGSSSDDERHDYDAKRFGNGEDRRAHYSPPRSEPDFTATSMADTSDLMSSWIGINSPQFEATESYVIGQGCNRLPGINRLGGPSGLSNLLASKVMMYSTAGYTGHKLRDMVSNAFATDIPGSGPWNVGAGSIDWNLYHDQRKTCTVAVKLPDWNLDWIVYGQ